MKRNEKESLLAVLNDRYSRFTIPSESPVITFLNAHGERIVNIHGDGTVEIAEGLSTDDAARQFWVAVAAAFPGRPECRAASSAARGEAVAFLYTLEYGSSVVARKASTYRLNYPFGGGADYRPSEDGVSYVRETPLYLAPQAPPAAADAWAEGYKQGVQDERTSEANIGICGFGGKVEPARENPYGKAPPAAVPVVWQYRFTPPDGLTWSDWQPIPSEEVARETVEIVVKIGTKAEWRALAVMKDVKP